MTQRKRSIGIYCGGAALWGLALVYFVAFSNDSSDRTTVRAAEPPVPVAKDESIDDSGVAGQGIRSRTSRLLDAIRPSRLLRRKAEPVEPQRLNPKQSDATNSIPMQPAAEPSGVQHPAATIGKGQDATDRTLLPVEILQTAASIPERINPEPDVAYPVPAELAMADLINQTPEEAWAKSWGCVECHKESHDPHMSEALQIGCTDCHGGNANTTMKEIGHVHPRFPDAWPSAANPARNYTVLNHEYPEFVRFVNPGDLRVAHISCGMSGCHPKETLEVKKSMMTHGCMLWGAALYNNGAVTHKVPRYGESYSMYGTGQRIQTVPPPTEYERDWKGVVPFLEPLPRFQTTQISNILRTFERGGRFAAELGIPERGEEPGRPRQRSSNRGMGTLNRTDPVFVGLAKTRLLDPTLNFAGTNDHPGDYRQGGCTSCHVIYANDRSPVSSGPYAKYGNRGKAASEIDDFVVSLDPTIPKWESGHPITHRFTTAIPTSQCMICHMHPGTTVMNSYIGYIWSDQETDGEHLYPQEQADSTSEEFVRRQMNNPNDIDAKMLTSDHEFLADIIDLNPQLQHTLADFHGHGWNYRAVFKKDRQGTLMTHEGKELHNVTPQQKMLAVKVPEVVKEQFRNRDYAHVAEDGYPVNEQERDRVLRVESALRQMRENTPVHMLDIHLEMGMHCVDCHFVQDNHGDTKLYGGVRDAIEITCTDCHGTISEFAPLRTSGPAAKGNIWPGMVTERNEETKNVGRNLAAMRTPFGKRRFEELPDGTIVQNSMVEPDLSWRVKQVRDTITPSHPDYNALSALSKTVRFSKNENQYDFLWGDVPEDPKQCAHAIQDMNCIACHSSWNPSCFGCHLVQKADKKMPELHYEGDVTKNYTSYNFQTLRDDVFMLGKDGNATGQRINPVRSACAVHVSSYNGNRENLYYQQQTISAEGLSGCAFSTNVPHTVRGRGETKMCADCHLSGDDDNNAIMSQLLMLGTKYMNHMGRYAWIAAGEHGVWSPVVQERDEPQSIIGSTMHRDAFPDYYKQHLENDRQLQTAYEHPGRDIADNLTHPGMKHEILNLQHRGEYLYAACGEGGFRIFDIAFTDHKGFAERYTTAPVSPLGQKFYVRSKNCTDVASPSTMAPDPTRTHQPENFEQAVPMRYAFIYCTDSCEGLFLVLAGTLLDGNPNNNFVKKDVVFNPDGILNGARRITVWGKYAWIACDVGMVIVNIEDHKNLHVVKVLPEGEWLNQPGNVEFQFRYAFICDHDGIKVMDVTNPEDPEPVTALHLEEAHNIYVARTYAYVATGSHGLTILDVKNPRNPKVDQVFTAGGKINDLHDVKLGFTYASAYAYLADGHNGLHVVQLTSPKTPGNDGFSPRPTPQLVSSFKIPHGGHALAVSEAFDRDRAVDEAGDQLSVFGRIGARPMNLEEMQKLYLLPGTGTTPGKLPPVVWKVRNPERDNSIENPRQREIDLHQKVEEFFGESQLRKR
ncbi:MAG: hypothetical protein O2983_08980 [Planctomycetota bacterium]|nr:hypothetical protein [Planctomycetota bacterium]MDA0918874.1 hypothetical protein [Planctomycetota bacterium]MDA1159731.1 hypothetical protein [Planctomycetota bacterium]